MKSMKMLAAVAALALIAACGSSSSTPATATSTETQVAASAASERTVAATGQAVLQSLQAAVGAMVVKNMPEGAAKEAHTITQQISCDEGGSITVAGNVNYTCETLAGATNCVVDSSTLELTFDNCAKNVTLLPGGTTYATVLGNVDGTTTNATLSGTASSAVDGTVTVDVAGTIGGTVYVSGDVSGDVLFGSTAAYTATGVILEGGSPTLGCTGTASVQINSTTQTCTLASDCNGCSA